MRLYFAPGACSLAPRIVACEAGLALEYDKVDLNTQTTASGRSFRSINPKGHVPALSLENGEILTEVPAVLEYLADRAPAAGLLPPAGSLERYRAKEWIGFTGTELEKGFSLLWTAAMPTAARTLAMEHLHDCLAFLNGRLHGRSYLLGESFTAADAYCYAVLSWAHFHRVEMAPYGHVLIYLRRVAERPCVRAALSAEGLLEAA